MENVPDNGFQPVEGRIIKSSLMLMLGFLLVCLFVLIPLGAAVVWAWWMEFSLANRRISWYGAILGAAGFGIGLLGVIAIPIAMFRREQLILGEDCLQSLEGSKVRFQAPYRNIARTEICQIEQPSGSKETFIGIDLRDVKDPATLCSQPEASKASHGWHYRIQSGFLVLPLEQIHDLISKKVLKG